MSIFTYDKLVKDAVKTERIIQVIERSYEDFYATKLQRIGNARKMPFPEEAYSAIVSDDLLLIEGYHGTMTINKVVGVTGNRDQIFGFIKPIVMENISVYANMSRDNNVSCYYTNATNGTHLSSPYILDSTRLLTICNKVPDSTGNLTLSRIRASCKEIVRSLEIVNFLSVAGWYNDDSNSKIFEILMDMYRDRIRFDSPLFKKYFIPLL